ncbi:(Na+)-NQR maturation NqrM [Salinispirillum sp. LH 10-3-1]|uniref:(Na+)-NQR maturation NqrM n=1 Tax=Salinispirillum sp. LH 10-3-1 TaxID=2952525 RepID=A0AB38YJW1_9GAMM
MTLFITVFVFMLLVVMAMAVGVIFGRKPIAGSCGGLAAVGIEGKCEICGGDPEKCDADDEIKGAQSEFYDATKK